MAGPGCRGIRCGGCGEPLRSCACTPNPERPESPSVGLGIGEMLDAVKSAAFERGREQGRREGLEEAARLARQLNWRQWTAHEVAECIRALAQQEPKG